MTEKFQVSKRLDDGTIIVVGGDSANEFAGNLAAIIGETGRDEVRGLFYSLIPAGPPAAASAAPGYVTEQQGQANVQQAFQTQQAPPPPAVVNASPPTAAPLCPNHQQPAKWVPPGIAKATKRPYSGFFACAVSQQGDNSCRIPR